MGLFSVFKNVVGNAAEIKMLQNGADIFLRKNTRIEVFEIPSNARNLANEELKQFILSKGNGAVNEVTAALFKLVIFYRHAEFAEAEDSMEYLAEAMRTIRDYHRSGLDPEVSLQAGAIAG